MREIVAVYAASASGERKRDLLGHDSTRHPLEPTHCEQSAALGGVKPSNERDPALCRGCSHVTRRRRCRSRRGGRRAAGVRRNRARHRPGAIPTTGHDAARADHQHGVAATAPVAAQHDVDLLGRAARLQRAAQLPSDEPVADDHEPRPERRARGAASGAAAGPARRARRQPRKPGLDLQLGCDKPDRAS